MCIIKLNKIENQAVQAYTHSSVEEFSAIANIKNITLAHTGFTFQLNGALRANLQLSSETHNYLTHLDNAFRQHQLSDEIIVFRACNYLEMLRYLTKTTYVDLGYMSTSRSESAIHRFFESLKIGYQPAFLRIQIPAGSNVLDLDKIDDFDNSTYESEVLLKRKSVFDILSYKEERTENLQDTIEIEAIHDYDMLHIFELRFRNYLQDLPNA